MFFKIYRWIRDGILQSSFLIGIAMSLGIYMLGALPWWNSESVLCIFGASTEFSSFTFLFPIVAAIPYALRYRINRKSHFDDMILQRCSIKYYMIDMIAKTAISGFFVMAIGTFVFAWFISFALPYTSLFNDVDSGIIWPYMESIASKENWILYFGVYSLLSGISGIFWSLLSLCISAFIDNIYAIFIIPILFLYVMDYTLVRHHFYALSTLMFGLFYFESANEMILIALGTFGIMSITVSILFYMKGKKRYEVS